MLPSFQDRRAHILSQHPVWRPTTLDRLFAHAAEQHGRAPLVVTDEGNWSYADVAAQAELLARGLRAGGVRAGDRIALIIANYPDFVPLIIAVWRLGATAVPINFRFKAEELKYVIGQSQSSMLITMANFKGADYLAALDQIASGWREGKQTTFASLKKIVVFGGAPGSMHSFEQLALDGSKDWSDLPLSPAAASDAAVITYTSGTTGYPKGVIQTHDMLARASFAGAYHAAYEAGRRTLFSLPLYHAFALVQGLIAGMFVGGSIVPQLTFEAETMLAAIERHRATYLLLVPTMSVALLEHPDVERRDLSSLHAVLASAAPTPVWVWKALKEKMGFKEVFTAYGMTELGAATTMTAPDDDIEIVSTTVGRVIESGPAGMPGENGKLIQYKVADPFTGKELPLDVEGELLARGPTATPGYFNMPNETKALRTADGWTRSGDLGKIRSDGLVLLTGRTKEIYKSGGELVSPKEIEDLLTSHDGVAQAFVFGIPDDRWGEVGCAWIVPSPDQHPTAEELIELVRARLARFKVPRHVVFSTAEELPLTATGKVRKIDLARLVPERLDPSRKP